MTTRSGGLSENTSTNNGIGVEVYDIYTSPESSNSTPTAIKFFASLNPPTANITYLWDFGDGETSNEANPTHSYTYQNTFAYSLTATYAGEKGYKLATIPVTITGGNHQPQISATNIYPLKALALETIALSATAIDPDADALTYTWDFGDGTTATGATTSHIYYTNQIYKVILTVIDSYGAKTKSETYVGIGPNVNLPPTAKMISHTPPYASVKKDITFSVDASDAEGDTLQYAWDFGDGTQSNLANPTHQYSAGTVYSIVVTITDTHNNSTTISKLLNVDSSTQT